MLNTAAGRPRLAVIMAIAAFPPFASVAHAADSTRADASAPGNAPAAPFLDNAAFLATKLSEWNVVLGGGAMVVPKYEGSNEMTVRLVPFVSASYGDWLKIDPRGASVSVYEFGGLQLSGKLGYDLGRKEDRSAHLKGLGDIDPGAVVGTELAYKFGALKIYGELNRTIGGSDSFQARFGAEVGYRYERFLFTAGASAVWSDADYMQTYFGVTAAQSARSGLPVFDIGAGIKRVDVSASVTYAMTEHWLVRAQAGYGLLAGDVVDSPIVQRAAQPFGMLSIGYKF